MSSIPGAAPARVLNFQAAAVVSDRPAAPPRAEQRPSFRRTGS
jgi:hypothetical protein